MEQFMDILKEFIMESGVSLRQNAIACGISDSRMGKYLSGNSVPTIFVAESIANHYKCSFDYLFGISNQKSTQAYKAVDMSVFVERYIDLLKKNKTTHWKFSKANDISESSLRKWRKGEIPRMPTLITIAFELGSSIDYLTGRV